MQRPYKLAKQMLMKLVIAALKLVRHRAPSDLTAAKILIPAYTGLGNFIMMTPMVKMLRVLYPSSTIFIMAGNDFGTESVLEGSEVVNEIFILNEQVSWCKKLQFFLRLRKERIDVAFVPFNASPSFYRFGVVLAGIPRCIGHSTEVFGAPMGWTRDSLTDGVPVRLGVHETDLHFDLLEVLFQGVQRAYSPVVSVTDEKATLKRHGLGQKHYIALQVSAANGGKSPKIWPQEKFRVLIELLHAEGYVIVLVGDRSEQEIVEQFARTCTVPTMILAGKTSIREVASVVKCAAALICHDSGLMHIGNAMQTPTVALYGPTDFVYTGPRSEMTAIIRRILPCAPCMANFAKTEAEAYRDCPIQFECMKSITVDEVFAALKKQIALATKEGRMSLDAQVQHNS